MKRCPLADYISIFCAWTKTGNDLASDVLYLAHHSDEVLFANARLIGLAYK